MNEPNVYASAEGLEPPATLSRIPLHGEVPFVRPVPWVPLEPVSHYERRKARVLLRVTEREVEFLRLVCHENEYTYERIADLMRVHRRTVDGYREAIFGKFGVKSKVGLVLFAVRWGIVHPFG